MSTTKTSLQDDIDASLRDATRASLERFIADIKKCDSRLVELTERNLVHADNVKACEKTLEHVDNNRTPLNAVIAGGPDIYPATVFKMMTDQLDAFNTKRDNILAELTVYRDELDKSSASLNCLQQLRNESAQAIRQVIGTSVDRNETVPSRTTASVETAPATTTGWLTNAIRGGPMPREERPEPSPMVMAVLNSAVNATKTSGWHTVGARANEVATDPGDRIRRIITRANPHILKAFAERCRHDQQRDKCPYVESCTFSHNNLESRFHMERNAYHEKYPDVDIRPFTPEEALTIIPAGSNIIAFEALHA